MSHELEIAFAAVDRAVARHGDPAEMFRTMVNIYMEFARRTTEVGLDRAYEEALEFNRLAPVMVAWVGNMLQQANEDGMLDEIMQRNGWERRDGHENSATGD